VLLDTRTVPVSRYPGAAAPTSGHHRGRQHWPTDRL